MTEKGKEETREVVERKREGGRDMRKLPFLLMFRCRMNGERRDDNGN